MTQKMDEVVLRFFYIGCLVLVSSFMQVGIGEPPDSPISSNSLFINLLMPKVACWTLACERQIHKMRKSFSIQFCDKKWLGSAVIKGDH
ncbi:hypothetical protein RvY_12145 [Ramazzottius varieornatus]|uniref:Uncharacterized protein n=1 Tax=Ramazzottius varieornatus TaxID=947166 RepID=A0A1D1VII9_RAMVA|nr:hypothetical protein RvY_12145 [Ramazzottius varieornatus]